MLKELVIGRNADVNSIGVLNVSVNDEKVEMNVISANSMGSYKSFSYKMDGNAMYITLKSVSSISGWDGKISIKGDFSKMTEIYFYDTKDKKLVWQKQ